MQKPWCGKGKGRNSYCRHVRALQSDMDPELLKEITTA